MLLHLGHGTALLVGPGLRAAQGLFQGGQLALLLFALCRQQFSTFFAVFGLGLQLVKLPCRIVLARCPLGGLRLELLQPLLYAHPALDHKADFSLQATDFGAGFVQLALGLVDVVTRRVMRLANGFQISLNVTQVSHTAFQIIHGFFSILLNFVLVGLAVGTL